MMKRLGYLIVLALASALVAAGCGGDSEPTHSMNGQVAVDAGVLFDGDCQVLLFNGRQSSTDRSSVGLFHKERETMEYLDNGFVFKTNLPSSTELTLRSATGEILGVASIGPISVGDEGLDCVADFSFSDVKESTAYEIELSTTDRTVKYSLADMKAKKWSIVLEVVSDSDRGEPFVQKSSVEKLRERADAEREAAEREAAEREAAEREAAELPDRCDIVGEDNPKREEILRDLGCS